MEYKKIINLLENKPNQPTKFRTKKGFERNYDARETFNKYSQIKFRNLLLKPSLSDYSDA